MMVVSSDAIKRVVSCFLMTTSPPTTTTPSISSSSSSSSSTTDDIRIAVFHRVNTMPTFPSHWAACSGSIEAGETPWEACQRELSEETNLYDILQNQEDVVVDATTTTRNIPLRLIKPDFAGWFVDVPYTSPKSGRKSIIRVYPFALFIPSNLIYDSLELRGTEHDEWKWISITELDESLHPTVPALARAFHHATVGNYFKFAEKYSPEIAQEIHQWASDRQNGAAIMAVNAVQLVSKYYPNVDPADLIMLRPSMVAITNALNAFQAQKQENHPNQLLVKELLQKDTQRAVDYAVQSIRPLILEQQQQSTGEANAKKFTIATFSRSSTLKLILNQLLEEFSNLHILCSQSTPGDEGIFMAQDLMTSTTKQQQQQQQSKNVVECIQDDILIQMLLYDDDDNDDDTCSTGNNAVDLILTGCDCITDKDVVNKVGTKKLAQAAAARKRTTMFCCVDQWKICHDDFPPPLEDIFECIPKDLYTDILLPPYPQQESER